MVTVFSKTTLDAQVSASGNSLWTNPKDGMTFVWVPAGSFEIEIPYDSSGTIKYTKEKKSFPEGFWLGQTEVTVNQFQNFVKATGYITDAEKEGNPFNWREPGFKQKKNHPVVYISYQDIKTYTEWAGVDIPYENEWLYACKAGISNRL
jgi:formylglycine-generating enzyme required for sulfatase activity